MYFHPELFQGLDRISIADRSLSGIVEEQYYMRPIGGTQTFRITTLTGNRAGQMGVQAGTPVLLVKRFLHFKQAENAVYAELYCQTDRYVFSQQIGGPYDNQ